MEIRILQELVELAAEVRRSGTDRKWEELSKLLQDNPTMLDAAGERRKLSCSPNTATHSRTWWSGWPT